jgi:hypothetical protein
MYYVIASTGFRKPITGPSEPDGTAHAVLPGTQTTLCGLPVAELFYYDQDFTETRLPRCPDCSR